MADNRDFGHEETTRRLRRRLWMERVALLLLAVAFLVLYFDRLPGRRRVCLIAVDGEPVAVLASQAEAERLLDDLKDVAGSSEDGDFAQQVTLHSVPASRHPIQTEAEALAALSARVEVLVQASAILANDQLVVALPTQGGAVETLSLLLARLAPTDQSDPPAFFKERVRIDLQAVPVELVARTPEDAVQHVLQASETQAVHEVLPGETGWQIARDYRVSLNRLRQANPDLDLDRLRADASLNIPGSEPGITVVARKEVQEQVGEGLSRRTQTVRITYENGVEVSREIIARRTAADLHRAAPPPDRTPWRGGDQATP